MFLDIVKQKPNKLDRSTVPLTDLGLCRRCERRRLGALLCLPCLDLGFGNKCSKRANLVFLGENKNYCIK